MYEAEIQLLRAGRPREAIDAFLRLMATRSHDPDLHANLALAFEDVGDFARAERGYRTVLSARPDHLGAMCSLGNLLAVTGRTDEAGEALARANAVSGGGDAYCQHALGLLRVEQLDVGRALGHFAAAARIADTPAAWGTYLGYSLNAGPGGDAAAHQTWADRFAPVRPGTTPPPLHWKGPLVDRPLGVAFLGDVFRRHPCAAFLEPLLAALYERGWQTVAPTIYSDVPPRDCDAVTGRLKGLVAAWHDTAGLTDAALAEQLRADRIDVIVDLMGHKRHNRAGVLARRPAPVRLAYLGYPGDTGLATNIDRAVGWAYRPHEDAPPVSPSPAAANGYVTFGSLNRPAKITTAVLTTWARVLRAVPTARLRVVVSGGADNRAARARLCECGLPAERVELLARSPALNLADRIDLHLDTFPYGGGATTCDLLWQGVPTVAMTGDDYQMGGRIMGAVGLPGLVADAEDGYVAAAANAAGSAFLAESRRSMREWMFPLLDAAPVARRFEAACVAAATAAATPDDDAPCCPPPPPPPPS